ncbi:MAG TPA: hypothetical protein VEH27_11835 [Methylomirabilota bacterium]|nr:hypothetical protein [Methylomirabilota bacterium]
MVVPVVITSRSHELDRRVTAAVSALGQPVIHHVAPRRNLDPIPEFNRLLNIAEARTEAKTRALGEHPSEFFLFLDADIVPPTTTIEALLHAQAPVVGGWFKCDAERWVGGTFISEFVFRYFRDVRPGLTRSDLLSLGCCLVHRSILEDYTFEAGLRRCCVDESGRLFVAGDGLMFTNHVKEFGLEPALCGEVVCTHLKAV